MDRHGKKPKAAKGEPGGERSDLKGQSRDALGKRGGEADRAPEAGAGKAARAPAAKKDQQGPRG